MMFDINNLGQIFFERLKSRMNIVYIKHHDGSVHELHKAGKYQPPNFGHKMGASTFSLLCRGHESDITYQKATSNVLFCEKY